MNDASNTPTNPGDPMPAPIEVESPVPSPDHLAANDGMPNWRGWLRRLLICNPFYLCSAALLLLGVNRLSLDPSFLGSERGNLLFNFLTLQFYEVLLVATAVWLARRRIWYDSALLVVLENGLVLAPFMLISQALFLDLRLARALVVIGGLAAVTRFLVVKQLYPRFNLPPRALVLGGVVLALNLALPLVFRRVMGDDVDNWEGPNQFAWFVALPLLAAGANLLPRPARYGGLNPERQWLPLFLYGLWTVGSAVHVWGIIYICRHPLVVLQPYQLAPLACVCAWTLFNRVSDCLLNPAPRWRVGMLILAAAAPLLACGEPIVFFALEGITAIALLAVGVFGNSANRQVAQQLALVSVALAIAGTPIEWGRMFMPGFDRAWAVVLGLASYAMLAAIRSPRPELGLLGAGGAAVVPLNLVIQSPGHWSAEWGLVFLLLHSFRWCDAGHRGAAILRVATAIAWVLHAFLWTREVGGAASALVGALGTVVLAISLAACWRRRVRSLLFVPGAALAVILSGPLNWILRHGSDGVIAVGGSLLLFAIGTVAAVSRNHWDKIHGRNPGHKPAPLV